MEQNSKRNSGNGKDFLVNTGMTEARYTKKACCGSKLLCLQPVTDFPLALTMNYTVREKSEFQQDSVGPEKRHKGEMGKQL